MLHSFLFQLLILGHNALVKRGKNILRHCLFGNKIIQNFWNEACWFLSLRFFGLLSSSLSCAHIQISVFFVFFLCLPYVKGLAERIKKICSPYDIRTVFTSGSTFRRYLFRVKPPTEFNMTKNCVYSIPCSCGKIYKGETGRPLKVRLEEHRKAIVRGEIEKSGMADHIWKENGNHLPLWDKVEIIDRAEHWRIRRLKESAHMLGYNDLQRRPSIELNTIWEPIIKKAR